MKLKRILTSCFAVSALVSGQALADSEVRGAVTAVSNVASGVAAQTPHNGFRWAKEESVSGPAVNSQTQAKRSGFRWASHPASGDSNRAVAEAGGDANQSASRWVIRNDAGQAASRWVIRNDAGQAASRWVIRNDAGQAASRWVIRNDAGQAASRWVIR